MLKTLSSYKIPQLSTWRNYPAELLVHPLLLPAVLPWGMRKRSLVGTWLGFTGPAECIRPVVTNGLHCHPGSIVPIVTRNQTHTRGRRLIGCTLECFHPPLHMTEYWNSQPLVFATQSTVPTHIQGFKDKRAVNIWRFGTGCICCTVAGYLNGPAGILCVGMCVLSLQSRFSQRV